MQSIAMRIAIMVLIEIAEFFILRRYI